MEYIKNRLVYCVKGKSIVVASKHIKRLQKMILLKRIKKKPIEFLKSIQKIKLLKKKSKMIQTHTLSFLKLKKGVLKIRTSVMQFKTILTKENGVKNPANIKVIFAGKDLLECIVLDEHNTDKTTLFIYIRTEQEIFLMTAKVLKVGEEEDSDSDYNDDA